mmetsp:Transcript_28998/g.43812  ORF Transcript_28998/g.43812 Transcript_28998/m.43812 type:complete len:168 (-) Transcript_28998:240-743(-)
MFICTKSLVCFLLLFIVGTTQAYLFGRPHRRTATASLIRRNVASTFYGELAYYTPTEVRPSENFSIRLRPNAIKTGEGSKQQHPSLGMALTELIVNMFEFDSSVHKVECYRDTVNDTMKLLREFPIHILNLFIKLFQFENNLLTGNLYQRESFVITKKPAMVEHVSF